VAQSSKPSQEQQQWEEQNKRVRTDEQHEQRNQSRKMVKKGQVCWDTEN
jgi:hypothetical protein